MKRMPTSAMVLAAGLGLRMRPLTLDIPKPLVKVAGKTLLDWTLDSAAAGGIARAVINVHHLGDQIITHTARRMRPAVLISDVILDGRRSPYSVVGDAFAGICLLITLALGLFGLWQTWNNRRDRPTDMPLKA